MLIPGYILIGLYSLALMIIFVFCALQFHLLLKFRKRNPMVTDSDFNESEEVPVVTVQLPIYNERFVVRRLIESVIALKYPIDKLEIQVLDDSTDDTSEICREEIEKYAVLGYRIKHVTRPERKGFKAGALQYGLREAQGELIAIFDADFVPRPDFLQRTVPCFRNSEVGVVQTRWEHLNQDYSLITRIQAFQLNVHFTVEQAGRQEGQFMMQFNGTAGIWRRSTIDDAGGWQADTLTEDLDLSYRAQLKGWKIRFLERVGAPAELPSEMNGFKSQQYRWMKGGAETARKLLPEVWKSPLPFITKLHATGHLMSSSIFLFILLLSISSVPLLFYIEPLGIDTTYFAFFILGWLVVAAVYFVANAETYWKHEGTWGKATKFAALFPMFLSFSMGLSLHNSIAVVQGLRGRKSAFIRTPKFNLQGISDRVRLKSYSSGPLPLSTFWEGFLAIYFLAAIVVAIVLGDPTFVIFHFLLAIGFGSICFYSIRHYREQI